MLVDSDATEEDEGLYCAVCTLLFLCNFCVCTSADFQQFAASESGNGSVKFRCLNGLQVAFDLRISGDIIFFCR